MYVYTHDSEATEASTPQTLSLFVFSEGHETCTMSIANLQSPSKARENPKSGHFEEELMDAQAKHAFHKPLVETVCVYGRGLRVLQEFEFRMVSV